MTDGIVNIAVIGLGNRGSRYVEWIRNHADKASLAAVVDPDPTRREAAGNGGCATFCSTDDFFASGVDTDAVVISCPDRLHFPLAMEAISRGMHVLVEKPMGTSAEECEKLVKAAREKGVVVSVCHELHHHPYYIKLNELLLMPEMGRIVAATHTVNSGIDRSLHNFVRGGWSREETAGPVFLSKCSHDVDLFLWLCRDEVARFSSAGSLSFFRKENAPEGSAQRCVDCPLEHGCAFSAVDLYRRGRSNWTQYIPRLAGETLDEAVSRELKEGPLGRCAFRCDNDVFDHQMVTLEMKGGAIINIFMNFLTREDSRVSYFSCTGGEIWADWKTIRYRLFNEDEIHTVDCRDTLSKPYHAGADFALTESFVSAITDGKDLNGTSAAEALASHLVCLKCK